MLQPNCQISDKGTVDRGPAPTGQLPTQGNASSEGMMEGGNMSPFVKACEDLQSAAPPCVWRNPEENGRLQGTNLHSRAQPRQCLKSTVRAALPSGQTPSPRRVQSE
jgi:hypothetical protein